MSDKESAPPVAELPAPVVEQKTHATPPPRRSLAQPLALLALAAAIGTAVSGYFIWHEVQRLNSWQQQVLGQIDTRTQALDQRLQTFKDRLDEDLAASERSRRAAEDEQRKLASAQAGLEDALGVLRAQIGRSQGEWVLAEVQYLLHIANQRAQLQRDAHTASAALRSADQRLQSLADPGYNKVRELLASEIAALDAVVQPDLAGITLTLDGLAAQVAQWPLQDRHAPRRLDATTTETGAAEEGDLRSRVQTVLSNVWEALRSLVVVRHNDAPIAPMLAPDQEFFLHENLRLQLNMARLAALQGQQDNYKASLKNASTWVQQQYAQDAPRVSAALAELQRLAAIDVHPALPDISASLRALREQHSSAGVTP